MSHAREFVANLQDHVRRNVDDHDPDDNEADGHPEDDDLPAAPPDRHRSPLTMALAPAARTRRRSELSLGLLVIITTVGGYVLVALANGPELPPDLYALLAWVFGLYIVAHLAIRRFAPFADATLLPLAAC